MDDKTRQLRELYARSFDDSQSYLDFFFENRYDGSNAVTAEESGKILSALYLIDKKLTIGQHNSNCRFISAAATLPEYRGRGILGKVMLAAFDRIRAGGGYLAALHPFSHRYYERFGFATISRVRRVTLNLLCPPDPYEVSAVGPEEAPVLAEVYAAFAESFDARIERSREDFASRAQEFCSDGGKIYLLRRAGRPAAYAMCDAPEEAEEAAFADPRALDELAAPSGTVCPIPCGEGEEYAMARILDFPGFLRLPLYKNLTRRLRLAVRDEFYPPASCRLELSLREGIPSVTPCEGYDLQISAEDLTRLAFGQEPRELTEAVDLFAKKINFIADKY